MGGVKRSRVVVRGVVQGVYFRDTCRQKASQAGVAGWVRNREDGSVEAVFEGVPASVDMLVAWTREGPTEAEVRQVDVRDEPPEGLAGFEVR